MVELKFFDVKTKRSFTTDKFKVEIRKGRKFAVADSPFSTIKVWRTLPRNFRSGF